MSTSATHQPVHPTFTDDPSDHARELVGTVAHEPVTPPSNGGGPRPPFRHVLQAQPAGQVGSTPTGRLARLRSTVARVDIRMRAGSAWLPVWLAVSTVVGMYLLSEEAGLVTAPVLPITYVLAGLAAGLIIWVIAAAATNGDALPDRANPRSYDDLLGRMNQVEAAIACQVAAGSVAPDAAPVIGLGVLKGRLHQSPPDPDWSTGIGYVNAWRDLHRVEEELIATAEPYEFDGLLRHDELRVEGSKLDRKAGSIPALLKTARERVDKKDPTVGPLLRTIREAVDDFRDRRFEALVQNRIYVDRVSLLLGLVAWALLCLAIMVGASKEVVTGASALYLIGAATGLFTRLRSGVSESLEDVFGYGQAQVRQSILVSGLAGVAGVFLVAVTGAAATDQTITITDALAFSAVAAVTAAAFGLAPGMLTDRLDSWAKTNIKDLESTTSGAGS